MAGRNKITIEKIAMEAGVSIATVSRLLSGKDSVKKETRQKILDTMKALDYSPDTSNGITKPEGKLILMSFPELSNPVFSPIIDGAQTSANRHGYHLLIHQSRTIYKSITDYETLVTNNSVSGMILLSNIAEAEKLESFNLRCPIVMCSEFCEGCDISYVSIDDHAAAKNATDYLLAMGRKKIVLMNSSLNNKYARHRESGYVASLQGAGIEVNEEWIVHLSDINFDLAMSSAIHILNSDNRPDAFFAVSDIYAAAIIKACKRLGLSVPQDVSVVGFDNTDITLMTDPAITTVSQPGFQLGYQACDLLVERINNRNLPGKRILLGTELIVRGSTL